MNLLWRIREGGEAPSGLTCRAAVVLIGTNDFYNHHEQANTFPLLLAMCHWTASLLFRRSSSQNIDAQRQKRNCVFLYMAFIASIVQPDFRKNACAAMPFQTLKRWTDMQWVVQLP